MDTFPSEESDKLPQIKIPDTEIRLTPSPVDYAALTAGAQITLLGETHLNFPVREHLIRHAHALKAAGITHYAIEAPSYNKPVLDLINTNEDPLLGNEGDILDSLEVGPMGGPEHPHPRSYANIIRALHDVGIKTVPIDIDQLASEFQALDLPTKEEEREAYMTEQFLSIIREYPDAKIISLIGQTHTLKTLKRPRTGTSSVAEHLTKSGISVKSAVFIGGDDRYPRGLTEGISQAALKDQEFTVTPTQEIIDSFLGDVEPEVIIHLKET